MIFFYLLIAVLPLNQNEVWSWSANGVTLVKYLGAVCFLPALMHIAVSKSAPPFLRSWLARWFLIYFAIQLISYLRFGGRITLAPSTFSNLFSMLVLLFITLALVDSASRLRTVLLVGIGSVAFNSLHVIRQWQQFHDLYPSFRTWGGLSGDPNYYTIAALLWLPVSFCLMVSARPRWERFFCAGCLVITFTGILLAASRGGFLGLTAAFLFLALRARKGMRAIILASCLIIPLNLALPNSPMRRLMRPTQSDEESADSRVAMWKTSLRLFAQNPVAGVGLTKLATTLRDTGGFVVSHNTYVDTAAELGLLGLIPYFAILISAYRSLGRVAHRARTHGPPLVRQVAPGMQAGVVTFAVSAFFITDWWERMVWLFLFLAICLVEIASLGVQRQNAIELPQRTAA